MTWFGFDIAACFNLWCWGMFGFGCQQYMFTLDVVDCYICMSLIYGEYLVNVHFSDIPHTFIPHFTLNSTEKIRIKFSANYLLTTFCIPQSAFRKIPLPHRCRWPVVSLTLLTKRAAQRSFPTVCNHQQGRDPSRRLLRILDVDEPEKSKL